jgi:hypothetical protein
MPPSPAWQDLWNLHIQQNQLRLLAQLVRTDKSVMRAAQVKLKVLGVHKESSYLASTHKYCLLYISSTITERQKVHEQESLQNTQLREITLMAILYYLQSESVLTHFAPSSSRSRSASSRHSLISGSSSFQSKCLLVTCVEEVCGRIFCRIALRSCRHDQ